MTATLSCCCCCSLPSLIGFMQAEIWLTFDIAVDISALVITMILMVIGVTTQLITPKTSMCRQHVLLNTSAEKPESQEKRERTLLTNAFYARTVMQRDILIFKIITIIILLLSCPAAFISALLQIFFLLAMSSCTVNWTAVSMSSSIVTAVN